jgi:hypothetical protein
MSAAVRKIFILGLVSVLSGYLAAPTLGQSISEVFPGQQGPFTIKTVITASMFGPKDVWDERTQVVESPNEIAAVARKELATQLQIDENSFRIDSVALQRFNDTKYWFFIVNFSQKDHATRETLPVLVRLNASIIPISSASKNPK